MGRRAARRRKVSAPQVVAAVALCAVLGLAFAAATSRFAGHGREGLTEFTPATVLSVSDGDTLYVRLDTGEEGFVRLIGVDAPESVNSDPGKNTPKGEAAAAFLRSVVSAGQTVYLVRDVSDHDKYGRWLRYVWLEVPEQPFAPAEVRAKMLQGILVAAGQARVTRFAPDTSYYDILVTISYTADRAA